MCALGVEGAGAVGKQTWQKWKSAFEEQGFNASQLMRALKIELQYLKSVERQEGAINNWFGVNILCDWIERKEERAFPINHLRGCESHGTTGKSSRNWMQKVQFSSVA